MPPMMHYYQQRLTILPIQLITLLFFLSFSFAQDSNATSPFTLYAASTMYLCDKSEITWTGGTPQYWLYAASGNGSIGSDSSLGEEIFMGYSPETSIVIYLSSSWTRAGAVIKFRIQDQNGEGTSTFTWSSVISSICDDTEVDPIGDGSQDHTTTKPTDTMAAADIATGLFVASTTLPPGQSVTSQERPTSTLGSSATSSGLSLPFHTNEASSEASHSNVSGSENDIFGSGSQQDSSSPSSGPEGSTNQPSALDGVHEPHPSHTVAPHEFEPSDTAPGRASLSSQSIGLISGAIVIAVLLWIAFLTWRWRRRNRPVALKPRKGPHGDSMQDLMDLPSEGSNSSHYPPLAEVLIVPRNQITRTSAVETHGGTVVPSYNEVMTGLYSSPNTPDPLWNRLAMSQIPRNI